MSADRICHRPGCVFPRAKRPNRGTQKTCCRSCYLWMRAAKNVLDSADNERAVILMECAAMLDARQRISDYVVFPQALFEGR